MNNNENPLPAVPRRWPDGSSVMGTLRGTDGRNSAIAAATTQPKADTIHKV
jgi:hypothetical protein